MEIMIVVFMLWSFFAMGFSQDEVEYGDTYRIRLPRKTESVGFIRSNISHVTILWNRDEPSTSYNSRQKVIGSYFFLEKVTRNDSGTYIMKDKDQKVISSRTLEVTVIKRYNTKVVGRYFDLTFNVEPDSCNIYFIRDGGYETQVVRKGKLLEHFDDQNCDGLDFLYPCGIYKNYIQLSCNGRFEVRDKHGDLAIVETVEVEGKEEEEEEEEEPKFDTSTSIGIGIGAILGGLSCCCCTIRFCNSISSSKKDKSESPDEEPTGHYRQYEREPVRPSSDQLSRPSETLYPTVPPYNLSVPLIHNPPSVSVPPAYSEVSAPAEPAVAPAEQTVAPTFPVPSEDPGPRFELSISSALPLSSNSTFSDVYTSDKLNF
nr:uncharacterized protein LOC109992645 isoform X2 [Labrus bergylta]